MDMPIDTKTLNFYLSWQIAWAMCYNNQYKAMLYNFIPVHEGTDIVIWNHIVAMVVTESWFQY